MVGNLTFVKYKSMPIVFSRQKNKNTFYLNKLLFMNNIYVQISYGGLF